MRLIPQNPYRYWFLANESHLNFGAIVAKVTTAPRWLPVLIGVGVSTASVFLWQALTAQERAQIEQMILVESSNVKNQVTAQLRNRTLALVRMTKRWEIRGGTPKQEWESDAQFNVSDYGGFQAIEWVDSSFHVRWIVPRSGNEAAQNLNLAREERRRIALETARNQHQVTVTRSINLVQGGKGFRVYVPIFQGEDFRGFILGVFRVQQLLDTILAADKNVVRGYSIAVFDGKEQIYSRNIVSRQHEKEWGQETKINLYGVIWRMRVWPTPELLAREQSPFPKIVLFGGLVMAWLLALAVHLAQKTRFQQQQTEVSNQELRNEIAERQRAQAGLRESEERFKTFMNNSPVMAFIKDEQGRYIYVNEPLEHTFNLKLSDLQGKTDFDWLPELTAKQVRENDVAVLSTSKTTTLIETVPTPGGSLHYWLVFKFLVKDVSGQRLLGGVAVDITERQQVESALLESQTRLSLINSISTGITSGISVQQVIESAVKRISGYFNTLRVIYSTIDQQSNLTVIHSIAPPGMSQAKGKIANLTAVPEYLYALRVSKLVVIEDVATNRWLIPLADEIKACGTRAILEVPLQHSEQLLGLLSFDSPETRKWSEHEIVTLREVADYLSVAIKEAYAQHERQRIEAELQQANEKLTGWVNELKQRNHEIALLGEISDVLQACLTAEEAYTAISTMIQPLFPGASGGIFLISASKNLVEAVATWGVSPLSSQELFTPDECWALRRGRIHLVETHSGLVCNLGQNTHNGLVCKHLHPNLSAESVCVPMMAQGEALGVLYLSSLKLGELAKTKQQLAVTIAEQISLSLANLKLRETLQNQSIRDALTGLFNRRYLEESLEREIHRAKRKQQSLGIIMLDIDHFKRFNDTFGHEAGDTVLRELGLLLQQYVRQSDIACRYGGEEFTLILPEASLEIVRQRAEQLRQAAKQLQVQHRRQSLGAITLSLGVACFPEHGSSAETVIRAADAALYCAKAEGRNAVRLAQA